MLRFGFIRHGQTAWNALHKLQGRADIPLNEMGVQQAHSAKELIKKVGFTKIITSPLIRSLQTAEILNEVLNVEIVVDEALSEIDFRSNEGRIRADVIEDAKLFPKKYHLETMFPFPMPLDAEDLIDFDRRIEAGILGNLEKYSDDYILFSGHGGYLLGVQKLLLGPDRMIEGKNAVPYLFCKEDQWQAHEVNEIYLQSLKLPKNSCDKLTLKMS